MIDKEDKNVRKLIEDFFAIKNMEAISSDHHKQCDGILTFEENIDYDYWDDRWCEYYMVEHNGYIRDEIIGVGTTLEEAINDFRYNWSKKSKEVR